MTKELMKFAINYGNPILAYRSAEGFPAGVSVDIACLIAERMCFECQFVTFEAAKDATAAVASGVCDIGFFAVDPSRAEKIAFTDPYLAIQGNYLVREGSPYLCNEDVDQHGVLIGVGTGSAYDLFLTRNIRRATLVRESTSPEVVNTFIRLDLDVAAGVRAQLEADASRLQGLRLIEPCFMQIEQAIGVPKSRGDMMIELLNHLMTEIAIDGVIDEMLLRHGVLGAVVLKALKNQ